MTDWTKAQYDLTVNVIGGVLGGIAYALIVWIIFASYRAMRRRRFRSFFGVRDSGAAFTLVFSEFELRAQVVNYADGMPYHKPGDPSYRMITERPVASCDLRGINYLASVMGKNLRMPPSVKPDTSLSPILDLDFISFGLGSNLKTRDALRNTANNLMSWELATGEVKSELASLKDFPREAGYDYGWILKVHPAQFPKRTWICCAGHNEWGTSGAAYFLANKWKEIASFRLQDGTVVGDRCFAALVKVRPNQDESTELVMILVNDKNVGQRR